MTKMSVVYNGNLRCKITHVKSETQILSDAPLDNHGLGESFSPTDLLSASLAACMITILGIKNDEENLGILNMECTVLKEMNSTPRRIKRIILELKVKMLQPSEAKSTRIRTIAENCPVALSLNPEIDQDLIINYFS